MMVFRPFIIAVLIASIVAQPNILFAASNSVLVRAIVPEVVVKKPLTATSGGTARLINTDSTAATLIFPTNFYSQNVTLKADSFAPTFISSEKPPAVNRDFVGKAYDFRLEAAAGQFVSAVNQPIAIVLTYTDADISGLDESSLAPYRWGSDSTAWELIVGATINTSANSVSFSTTQFSSFALFAGAAATPPLSTPPASSGGGGGAYSAPLPSVVFSGRAYPLSKVTVLKDGQIAVAMVAGPDARFDIALYDLSAGNYNFSAYSEDTKGIRSLLQTFPLYLTSGATIKVGGIFIAPTVAVTKSEVKRGDNIDIFGYAAPDAEITIAVHSDEEFFLKTVADNAGSYFQSFDTTPLSIGRHETKSKATVGVEISSFSQPIAFTVGTKNIVPTAQDRVKGDINNDTRVNLVDFSIVAYWHKRPKPPVHVDLNSDGKIDLRDFSILAFYWTG